MKKALCWSASMCALAGSLVLVVPGPAGAAPPPGAMALGPAFGGRLYGVAAISNRDVWAAGLSASRALIVHWNGSSWSQSQPAVGYFNGIGASSARDVWAVGGTNWFSPTSTLAEHWNGSSWNKVVTPSPAGGGYLNAVAATSPSNAWAVGLAGPGPGVPSPAIPLIEHWNGRTWTKVPAPNEGIASFLHGVTAVSGNNAWAVGSFHAADGTNRTLALHWNGSHWTVIPSQSPGGDDAFIAVAASWTHNIWAVGIRNPARCSDGGPQCKTLVEHWDSTRWTLLASPNPPAAPTTARPSSSTGTAQPGASSAGFSGDGLSSAESRW